MRTVTFSDTDVALALNGQFVATWINREPGFHNCDLSAERWISSLDCFATKNFCTFFATPDLDVLHYASGYYNPKLFLQELDFVRALKRGPLNQVNRLSPGGLEEFTEAHFEHAETHDLEEGPAEPAQPPRDKRAQPMLEERRKHRLVGIRHLADVHLDLAKKVESTRAPVKLDDVFTDHLFGNPFEETQGRERPPKRQPKKSPGMQ